MVVDTSVIIAIFFDEEHGTWAAEKLKEHAAELRMSTVNLAETLVLLRDRQPRLYERLEQKLLTSGIRFIPPDVQQAQVAARARVNFPLNFGDCFAYALAAQADCPILTLDRDFRTVDLPVVLPA